MKMSLIPPLSERELLGAELARTAAADGMVLLENDGTLPLDKHHPLAFFGNGAARTIRGGTGSGDPFNGGLSGGGDPDIDNSPRYHIQIMDALTALEIPVVNLSYLKDLAARYDAKRKVTVQNTLSRE